MYHSEQDIKTDDMQAFGFYCQLIGAGDDRDRAAHNFLINRSGPFDTPEEAAINYAGEEALTIEAETEEDRIQIMLEWLYLVHFVFDHPQGVLVVQTIRPYYSNGHDNLPSLTGAW